ncbi:MAG: hypothetical protein M3Z08_01245 [Chloroflexota bacterium]|nr:hypothetical protein [Chloroflexota bacterium]
MFEDFAQVLDTRWTQTCIGGGSLHITDSVLRMALEPKRSGEYADAQIDDYANLSRSAFPWRPPLRMEVRARSSLPAASAASTSESPGILRGTAGFGFWNYPFSVRGDILMLPEAVWFFYASPPSNMALVPQVPGWGWKAQVIHSMRLGTLAATLPTGLAAARARLTGETQPAARWLQRLSGAREALLNVDMTAWHSYVLEWLPTKVLFFVDDRLVLQASPPPTRPLGFVAWLDNQYAVATPRGVLRFGATATAAEWCELDSIRIDAL